MLVLSVVVIAVVAAAFEFVPGFRRGVAGLAKDVSSLLASNAIGGTAGPGVNGSNPFGYGFPPPPGGANTGAAPPPQEAGAMAPAPARVHNTKQDR